MANNNKEGSKPVTAPSGASSPSSILHPPSWTRYLIAIVLLAATMVLSYATPRVKYQSPDMLSKLIVPREAPNWRSRDISNSFQTGDQRYFFISKVFARQYRNDLGESLVFLILDAGNFHHPKACFGSSGYTVVPLEDVKLNAAGRQFKGHVLHMQKGRDSLLLFYWMTIDKKPVGWFGQKFIQLFYSMAHKQKIGLMGRLEVPVPAGNIPLAISLAKSFIRDIGSGIPPEQADYLFGKQ